jgi:signal peptidase
MSHSMIGPIRSGQARSWPAGATRIAGTATKLATSLFLVAGMAAFLALAVGPHVFGYRPTTMLSGSMSPTIRPGDVVIDVAEPVSAVQVGQILTIQTPTPTHFVDSHRVIQVVHTGGQTLIRTKGDANSEPDPWLAQLHGDTVWRVRAVVPELGQAIIALRSPIAHLLLIWIALPLFVLAGAAEIWRKPRSAKQD